MSSLVYFDQIDLIDRKLLLGFSDWNNSDVPPFRKGVNYDVPCYFMTFPPYRKNDVSVDFCPVEQFSSPTKQIARLNGKMRYLSRLFFYNNQ